MGKVHCAICRKRCKGDVLKLHDSYFHKDCFKCQKCSKSLETGGFFEKEGQYYCTEDYRQYFGVRCRLCDEFVEGEVVTALGNVFHRHCLHCQGCRSPFLPGDRVTLLSGRFMCKRCCAEKENMKPRPASTNGTGTVGTAQAVTNGQTPRRPPPSAAPPAAGDAPDLHLKDELRISVGHEPVQNGAPTDSGVEKTKTEFCEASPSYSLGSTTQGSMTARTPTRSRRYPSASSSVTPRFASDFGKFFNQSYLILEDQRNQSYIKDRFKRSSSPVPYPPKSPQFHRPSLTLFTFNNKERHSFRDMYDFQRMKKGTSLPTFAVKTAYMYERDRTLRSTSNRPHSSSSREPPPRHENGALPTENGENGDYDSEEAIRLSTYPGGYQPDPSVPPPIDRYDWPAPASPAIILAEKRREKRRAMTASSRDSMDSTDYRSAASLDQDLSELSRTAGHSGMAQAVMRDLSDERKKLSRSLDIDPISASRTPSANREPPLKTRYEEHSFASPSRDSQRSRNQCHSVQYPLEYAHIGNRSCSTLPGSTSISSKFRPGYTAGILSECKAASLPPHGLRSEPLGLDRLRPTELDGRLSSMTTTSGLSVGDETWDNSTAKSTTTLTKDYDDFPGYPYVLHLSTPSSIFRRREAAPPKIYPYELLKLTNPAIPKDVDRTQLEKHLAEDEFELVFKCSRPAFDRLPEWRRNDLKKRVHLF